MQFPCLNMLNCYNPKVEFSQTRLIGGYQPRITNGYNTLAHWIRTGSGLDQDYVKSEITDLGKCESSGLVFPLLTTP